MHVTREWFAALLMWLGFMTACGIVAVRIAMLLYWQRRAEHWVRMRMAAAIGQAVRESSKAPGEPA